jgi:hypothetical protein
MWFVSEHFLLLEQKNKMKIWMLYIFSHLDSFNLSRTPQEKFRHWSAMTFSFHIDMVWYWYCLLSVSISYNKRSLWYYSFDSVSCRLRNHHSLWMFFKNIHWHQMLRVRSNISLSQLIIRSICHDSIRIITSIACHLRTRTYFERDVVEVLKRGSARPPTKPAVEKFFFGFFWLKWKIISRNF